MYADYCMKNMPTTHLFDSLADKDGRQADYFLWNQYPILISNLLNMSSLFYIEDDIFLPPLFRRILFFNPFPEMNLTCARMQQPVTWIRIHM